MLCFVNRTHRERINNFCTVESKILRNKCRVILRILQFQHCLKEHGKRIAQIA